MKSNPCHTHIQKSCKNQECTIKKPSIFSSSPAAVGMQRRIRTPRWEAGEYVRFCEINQKMAPRWSRHNTIKISSKGQHCSLSIWTCQPEKFYLSLTWPINTTIFVRSFSLPHCDCSQTGPTQGGVSRECNPPILISVWGLQNSLTGSQTPTALKNQFLQLSCKELAGTQASTRLTWPGVHPTHETRRNHPPEWLPVQVRSPFSRDDHAPSAPNFVREAKLWWRVYCRIF